MIALSFRGPAGKLAHIQDILGVSFPGSSSFTLVCESMDDAWAKIKQVAHIKDVAFQILDDGVPDPTEKTTVMEADLASGLLASIQMIARVLATIDIQHPALTIKLCQLRLDPAVQSLLLKMED